MDAAVLVLLLLGLIWAAVLIPPWLQSRRDHGPAASMRSFHRQLWSLEKASPAHGYVNGQPGFAGGRGYPGQGYAGAGYVSAYSPYVDEDVVDRHHLAGGDSTAGGNGAAGRGDGGSVGGNGAAGLRRVARDHRLTGDHVGVAGANGFASEGELARGAGVGAAPRYGPAGGDGVGVVPGYGAAGDDDVADGRWSAYDGGVGSVEAARDGVVRIDRVARADDDRFDAVDGVGASDADGFDHDAAAAGVVAPHPPSPAMPRRSLGYHRRRRVLTVLLAVVTVTLLPALLLDGSGWWVAQAVANVLLLSYMALLVRRARRLRERREKIHYLTAFRPPPPAVVVLHGGAAR